MWLVKYALKYRITFYVMAILILLSGIGAYLVMPKDVLPNVDIPVVTIVWSYAGLDTPDMERRVTTYTEFALIRLSRQYGYQQANRKQVGLNVRISA